MSESEHYDAKAGEFSERRKQGASLELVVTELKTEFREFRRAIEADLKDHSVLIQQSVDHATGLQMSMIRSQEQMQEGLQRQLDQNDQQHREIVGLFKDEIKRLFDHAELKIDSNKQLQEMTDDDQEKRIVILETNNDIIKTDIKTIKESKVKGKAGNWDRLQGAVVAAVIAVIVGAGVWGYNQAQAAAIKQVQAMSGETKK